MTNADSNDKEKYGLMDTKRIKIKQATLILYSFSPSDMIFKRFCFDFGKKKFTKKSTHLRRPFLSKVYFSIRFIEALCTQKKTCYLDVS